MFSFAQPLSKLRQILSTCWQHQQPSELKGTAPFLFRVTSECLGHNSFHQIMVITHNHQFVMLPNMSTRLPCSSSKFIKIYAWYIACLIVDIFLTSESQSSQVNDVYIIALLFGTACLHFVFFIFILEWSLQLLKDDSGIFVLLFWYFIEVKVEYEQMCQTFDCDDFSLCRNTRLSSWMLTNAID